MGPNGLVGPDQKFHIDAWSPVPLNVVTHAHSDHTRPGSAEYWCTPNCAPIIRHRLGAEAKIRSIPYGEKIKFGDIWFSFHPAGHILGSAQVRLERGSDVWVFTGDYKRDEDPSCEPFEIVKCGTFITEATFALPIYRWEPSNRTAEKIVQWWDWCREEKLTALLFCYALGKAQRILAELLKFDRGPVYLHGAVDSLTRIYREQGVEMCETRTIGEEKSGYEGQLVLAPPSAHRSPWMKRFPQVSTGFASGWMAVRGIRRQRGYERGFVLSDHADWESLLRTIRESECEKVYATHGNSETLARFVRENLGVEAEPLRTNFGEEED